jgi:hypothetical protein
VIPEALRQARSKKLAVQRERAERAEAKAGKVKDARVASRRNVIVIAVILVITGGVAFGISQMIESIPVEDGEVDRRAAERQTIIVRRAQDAVQERISTSGCTIVNEVSFNRGGVRTRPTMVAGGNCLELFVSSEGRARVDLTSPSGVQEAKAGPGMTVLRHCAQESGTYTLNVHADEFAQTLVECPHPRHAYKDDAEKTGLAWVQSELAKLQKRGCRKVLLVPDLAFGERKLSGEWHKGRTCPVTVAATGIEENVLRVTLKSPLNEDLPVPPAGTTLQVATCPKSDGLHAMTIHPTTFDFYAVGSVDCPKRVAKSLLAQ